MRPTIGVVVLLLGCSGGTAESGRDTAAIPSRVTQIQALARGNYLGTFTIANTEYGAYLRVRDSISAFYDGLRWIRICELTQNGTAVSFRTAPMFERVFVFRGTAQGPELSGRIKGLGDSVAVVFHRLDDKNPSELDGREKNGFYSDLRYIEEAGDNVGEELFVGSIAGHRTVALMVAEGAAGLPRIGLNLQEVKDTISFATVRDTALRAAAVFRDSGVVLSIPYDDGPPPRLKKLFSLQGFYDQPAEGECHS
jgi:hypothetical protein